MAAVAAALAISLPGTIAAQPAEVPDVRVPVIVDTDIGTDIDDALALALVLASPELELRGVTTVGGDAQTRAGIVCQMLDNLGAASVPVASGEASRAKPELAGQFQYGLRARHKHPVKPSAVEFLHETLKAEPGKLTVIALGPLTNLAALFDRHPESKAWIKRLVVMGGALRVGYNGRPPAEVEWNIRGDIPAARAVFAAGVPLTVAPLDASATLKLDGELLERLLKCDRRLCRQVQALYELWGGEAPVLFDPAAVAMFLDTSLFQVDELAVEIDERGMMQTTDGKPTARVASSVRRDDFLKWYVAQVTHEKAASHVDEGQSELRTNQLQPAAWQRAAGQRLPARVHVFEDYETDIERRWWLAGLPETKNVPPGSSRACRGVLCKDFDDKQGQKQKTWRAVIFNPVPGPPMGASTQLNFRLWLRGTDTVRVQIYSLSNGYHRQLSVTGIPQNQWEAVTVDMTQLRRPDGTGGPLAENERIDDIQFYVAPEAELLIDDIVLYEPAPAEEKQPLPVRFAFTGGFDTGKQGVEWPGTFEIVAHQPPRTWKAAQSVPAPDNKSRIIRIDLRGERTMRQPAALRFAYHLTGADRIDLELVGPHERVKASLDDVEQDAWTVAYRSIALRDVAGTYRELIFRIPAGGRLQVDDVLLFEP